jgi:hypothetical protein
MVKSLKEKFEESQNWHDDAELDDDGAEIKNFSDLKDESLKNEWGNFPEIGFQLAGKGKITSKTCGSFGFKGCLEVELHNHIRTLDGVDHTGKVFIRKYFKSCDKPTCPICYARGWANREAKFIEARIKDFELRLRKKAEHIIQSVAKSDYGMTYEALKAKALRVFASRGVVGGVMIFHAGRYRSREKTVDGIRYPKGWYFAPHYHCIGFLADEVAYSRCRHCRNHYEGVRDGVYDHDMCMRCRGYCGRQRRAFENEEKRRQGSGYITKVRGERKSIRSTAWYQLEHSSVKIGVERFRVTTWFGVCSYRQGGLKREVVHEEGQVCPICGHELEQLVFLGGTEEWAKLVGRFWENQWEEDYKYDDHGVRWMPKPERQR